MFHPTTVGVALGAVIVGIVTLQLVAWAFPLYVEAIVQLKSLVLDNVELFPFTFAVYVIGLFVVIKYHVLLALLLDNVNLFVVLL